MAAFSNAYGLVEEADNKWNLNMYLHACYKFYKGEAWGGDTMDGWMDGQMNGFSDFHVLQVSSTPLQFPGLRSHHIHSWPSG